MVAIFPALESRCGDAASGHAAEAERDPVTARTSLDFDQFDVEEERRIGRNHSTGALLSVALLRWDDQRTLATHLHAGHAFVPTFDDLPGAQQKGERDVAVHGAVEFLAMAIRGCGVVKPAR